MSNFQPNMQMFESMLMSVQSNTGTKINLSANNSASIAQNKMLKNYYVKEELLSNSNESKEPVTRLTKGNESIVRNITFGKLNNDILIAESEE